MLRHLGRMLRPFGENVTPFGENVTLAMEEEHVMEGIPIGKKRHDDAVNIGNTYFEASTTASGDPKKKNKKEKAPITPKEKNKIKTPLLRARK